MLCHRSLIRLCCCWDSKIGTALPFMLGYKRMLYANKYHRSIKQVKLKLSEQRRGSEDIITYRYQIQC